MRYNVLSDVRSESQAAAGIAGYLEKSVRTALAPAEQLAMRVWPGHENATSSLLHMDQWAKRVNGSAIVQTKNYIVSYVVWGLVAGIVLLLFCYSVYLGFAGPSAIPGYVEDSSSDEEKKKKGSKKHNNHKKKNNVDNSNEAAQLNNAAYWDNSPDAGYHQQSYAPPQPQPQGYSMQQPQPQAHYANLGPPPGFGGPPVGDNGMMAPPPAYTHQVSAAMPGLPR
jgi:hypothetical protein